MHKEILFLPVFPKLKIPSSQANQEVSRKYLAKKKKKELIKNYNLTVSLNFMFVQVSVPLHVGRWTGGRGNLPEPTLLMWQGPVEQASRFWGPLEDSGAKSWHRKVRSKHGVSVRMTTRKMV